MRYKIIFTSGNVLWTNFEKGGPIYEARTEEIVHDQTWIVSEIQEPTDDNPPFYAAFAYMSVDYVADMDCG